MRWLVPTWTALPSGSSTPPSRQPGKALRRDCRNCLDQNGEIGTANLCPIWPRPGKEDFSLTTARACAADRVFVPDALAKPLHRSWLAMECRSMAGCCIGGTVIVSPAQHFEGSPL